MLCDARRLGVCGGAILALVLLLSAVCDATAPIQQNDWQYRDLDALSQAGLIVGHPKAPLSTWAEGLTRYEAASLVLRAVEGVGKAYQAQGETLVRIAQAEGAGEAPPTAAVTPEDLARVEKLIEEFRAELVTMGVRVDDLATAVKDVQQRLAKVEAERKQHQIDGYLQFRYRDDNAPDGKREFQVRRVRVNLRGPVSERTAYRIEFQLDAKEGTKGPGSKVQLRTATLDYKMNRSRFQLGQAILPWGYELQESVPSLWTGERSLWMDRLFPEQRDIGLLFNYRPTPRSPQFDLGLVNGTGLNAVDNNDRTNVLARLDFPVRNGTVALSTYRGSNGGGAAAKRQDRDGLSARLKRGGTEFLGEFVNGKDAGHDVRGWYAQLGHPLLNGKPNLLFAKYDTYDENRDLANDLFTRWSLGYWYDVDKATRLTFVWESRDVEPNFSERNKWDGNACYLQAQTRF